MKTAPVTVVVPCYRCAATIERAIVSVAEQTHRPGELVLVDDASADGTLEVLHALATRYGEWVKVIELPSNRGAASARNAGWDVAMQPYIAFLDADDAWHPRKTEIQCGYMRDHPEVALSGHLCRQLPPNVQRPPDWALGSWSVQPVTWTGLLVRHAFVTPSVMLKRAIPLRFAEGLRHMEDHRLWLEIVGSRMLTVRLHIELAAIYKPVYGASGLSADMWNMEKAELANYRHFHNKEKISRTTMLILQCYSLLKFARRLVIARVLSRF